MNTTYPRRLSRYYATQLLWLIDYGTLEDLAAFPPFVQTWVRDIRASLFLPAPALRHTTAPTMREVLVTLLGERMPLL